MAKDLVFETNLISCDVSDKDWCDFEGQTTDIINFLEKHHIDLQRIKDNFEHIDWKFDLPYYCRLDENTINQNDFLSPKLLFLSGRLGIGINLALYQPEED